MLDRQPNPQIKNVGNLGDILKHAALAQFAQLASQNRKEGESVVYLDSHAFTLESDCPDREKWRQEVKSAERRGTGYQRYFQAERQVLEGKPYRCSAGLALDLLDDPFLILAEKDPKTRAALEDQIELEGEPRDLRALLLGHSDGLGALSTFGVLGVGPLLALIDPFRGSHLKRDWDAISRCLTRLSRRSTLVVAEVCYFGRRIAWPVPPAGLLGPLATLDRNHFHLAVYATASVNHDVLRVCASLGWDTSTLITMEKEVFPGRGLPMDAIHELCHRYRVKELSLFGSALRADFARESDLDFLVEFDADAVIGFLELARMQNELSKMVGRRVDLVPKQGLKSPIRHEVIRSAKVLYEA
jgi:predicted nucleotidyltransferase